MYKAKYLSPIIPSFKMEETVSFFTTLLGFSVSMNETTYSILNKDSLTIHIVPAGTNIGEMEFYLEVDDIEQVWQLIKNKLDGLAIKEPFNREYGMREIHIIIPQTKALLFIGQPISK